MLRKLRAALSSIFVFGRSRAGEVRRLREELAARDREYTETSRAFEERYQNVVRQAKEGIYIFEPRTGRIREVNPAYRNMLGYTEEELLRMSVFDVIAHDHENVEERIRETISQGSRDLGERRHRRKDGSVVDVEVGTVMISQRGERLLCAIVRDVTGRKKAEESLRQSEELYRAVVEQTSEGLFLVDTNTRLIFQTNSAFQRLLGFTARELEGMSLYDLVAESRESVDRNLKRTLESRSVFVGERLYRRKDGSTAEVEVSGNLISYGGYEVLCAIVRDTTERKRAERALEKSKNSLAAAQTIASLGNFEYSVKEDKAVWSDELFRIFGTSPQTFTPTYREFLNRALPEDREALRREVRKALYRENRGEFEYRIVTSGGQVRDVHSQYEVIRDSANRPTTLIGTVQDITERKQSDRDMRRSEERFRATFEQAAVGIAHVGLDGSWLRINQRLCEIIGYSREELLETTFQDITHPDDLETDLEHLRQLLAGEIQRYSIEKRYFRKEGSVVWINLTVSLVRDASGEPDYFVSVAEDITERKQAEKEAREWSRYSRNLFDVNLDALFTVDAEGRILDANPSMSAMTGVPRDGLIGRNIFGFLPQADLDREEFEETLTRGYTWDYESTIRHADGRVIPVLFNATVYQDHEGNPAGVLASARDTTERNRLIQELERLALHDSLTGLPNRALLTDRLEQAMTRADPQEESVAVLFVDLDRFKVVNDSLGHSAGDHLLKETAGRLTGCLGNEPTLARVGGDEFVVLLEDVANAGEAAIVANMILAELQKPYEIDGQEVSVDASIGIALGKHGDGGANLLRNADIAMYSAKRAKRGDCVVFDPDMNAQAQARLKLENGLRRGIERGELRVHYQPKVDLHDGSIYGFEALVRWESPERGMVSPAEFIPLAEETGLIIPIGRHVLREACQRARAWQDRYPRERPLMVAVNVSAAQLRRTDIVEEVRQALRSTRLPAHSLCLEITESVIMEDVESNLTALIRLKSLGVRLAIDDFGTGYSSLSYLKRFPVDIIKIDRSFVDRMEVDSENSAIVESMITLSHTLGLEVVAEGVETREQAEMLRNLDCEFAQGFLFSRPLAFPEANELLAEVMLLGRSLVNSN